MGVKNIFPESSENVVSDPSSEFLVKEESDLFEAEEKDGNDLTG